MSPSQKRYFLGQLIKFILHWILKYNFLWLCILFFFWVKWLKYEIFYFPRSFDWVCIFKRICEFSSALYLFTFLKMSLVVKYLPVNRTKMKIQPSLKMNVWNRFFRCIWRIWTYGGSNSRKYLSFWKILGNWTLHNGCVTALHYSNVTMKKLFKFRKEISLTISFLFFRVDTKWDFFCWLCINIGPY